MIFIRHCQRSVSPVSSQESTNSSRPQWQTFEAQYTCHHNQLHKSSVSQKIVFHQFLWSSNARYGAWSWWFQNIVVPESVVLNKHLRGYRLDQVGDVAFKFLWRTSSSPSLMSFFGSPETLCFRFMLSHLRFTLSYCPLPTFYRVVWSCLNADSWRLWSLMLTIADVGDRWCKLSLMWQ
jgi:hypothetical protein